MKRVIALILVLLLLGGGVLFYRHARYARVNDELYSLSDTTELDLRGQGVSDLSDLQRCVNLKWVDLRQNALSAEQIDALCAALPGCNVRWDVPLGGERYDSESSELTLRDLDMDDWENLFRFPALRSLTVGECTRFDRLESLRRTLPECSFSWNVGLEGRWYSGDAALLELDGAGDAAALSEALSHFSRLTSVRIRNCALTPDEQAALLGAYPNIRFLWDVELGGQRFSSAASVLDLRGAPVDMQELSARMALFPWLREVDLTGCDVPLEERLALCSAYPNVKVLWNHEVCGRVFSSDAEEIDLSRIKMENTQAVEDALPYFPRLKKVVMSDCGFTNEEMDALNNRYEDVRFVWTVYFGTFSMRTDETQFIAARFTPWTILYNKDVVCLKYCTDLIALDFGHMAISDLSFLNYMPHMQYLILAECPVNDVSVLANLKELKYLEIFKAPLEDLTPLLQCTSLEDLNICYIWIKNEPAFEQLSQMTWLDRLWFCGTYFTADMKEQLQQRLPDCEMDLRWGAESTGGTWRKHPHYYEMRDAFKMYYMPGGTNGVDENGHPIINFG
ncbi:MAG: hypothetical protein PUC52_00465 [bacterium]|nr:hypothetical protein [bacterium]